MQIRYEITPSDHLEMLKVRFGFGARMGKILIGIAGILLGVFGYHFFGHAWNVVIAVFASLTTVQLFMPYIIHRKIYRRNPRLFEMRTVTFSDDGVKSERATTGNAEAKWSSFEKFKETKNLFLTYQTKDVVGIVPKRAFSNLDEIGQFRNLLASKLPRTGPFIPPITLPGIGDIVLTSAARESLDASGLTGFEFRPVHKVLTVELHWEHWDLNADEPRQFPDTGEPEDYVLGKPNSPSASTALGELWELSVPATATVVRPQPIVHSYRDLKLDINTWNGCDLIRSTGYGSVLFTDRARSWFGERWPNYIEFLEFPTTER